MLISAVMTTPLRLAGGGCDGPGKAMSYTPVGTSVQQLAERLVAEVEQLLSRTGADKVHLVGHSLGGVVIAQALADGRLAGRVDTV